MLLNCNEFLVFQVLRPPSLHRPSLLLWFGFSNEGKFTLFLDGVFCLKRDKSMKSSERGGMMGFHWFAALASMKNSLKIINSF